MTGPSTSYDEIDAPSALRADAVVASRRLRLDRLDPATDHGVLPSKSGVPGPAVREAAARLAGTLHLYLD
ncbi:MAG: hypothetical protein QM747_00915 [Nocardioides sp.]